MDDSTDEQVAQTATFPGRFESLTSICEFVTRGAQAADLDARAVYDVQMAVDEACTNIIEHAYGGEDRGDIECTCTVNDDGLVVALRDFGHPFDPASVPEPDLHSSLEERREGGLGLYFIRRLMDEAHFEFTAHAGNVLTLVKHRQAKEKTP